MQLSNRLRNHDSITIVLLAIIFVSLLWILSSIHIDGQFSKKQSNSQKIHLSNELEYAPLYNGDELSFKNREKEIFEYSFNAYNEMLPKNMVGINENLLRFHLPDKADDYYDTLYFENSILYEAEILFPVKRGTEINYEYDEMIDNISTLYVILPENISHEDYIYIKVHHIPYRYNLLLQGHLPYSHSQNLLLYYLVLNIGITFTMIIANLYLFYQLKEKLHCLHALFLLSFLHYLMAISGVFKLFGFFYSWKGYGYWAGMTYLSISVFIYFLLDIRNQNTFLKTIFRVLIVLSLCTFPLVWFSSHIRIFTELIPLFGVVLLPALVSSSFYIHFKSQHLSKYYLTALVIIGGGGIIMILTRLEILKASIYIENLVVFAVSLESFLFTMSITDTLRKAKLKIEELELVSATDKLTNLFNRHNFEKTFYSMLSYANRYLERISIIMFDLDHFKKINDTVGHNNGDIVLKRTAELVKLSIRSSDIAYRWGGEEFLILLPHTDIAGAASIAEKLREKIQDDPFHDICRVSASFGVIQINEAEPFNEWYSRVDMALYKAKRSGRNQVVPCFGCLNGKHHPFLRIEWQKAYECGHPQLDEQHKTLFDKINKFLLAYQAEEDLSILIEEMDDLLNHVSYHFSEEEKILKQFNYKDLESHSKIHKTLIDSAKGFAENLFREGTSIQEIYSLVYGDIIMGHLVSEDFKFFSHIKDHLNRQ